MRRASQTTILVLLALALTRSALAQPAQVLWPGVAFTQGVQFTPNGPVVLRILTGPRPGGLTALEPVLPGGVLTRRETLTRMQRQVGSTATAAGVNGDFFTWRTGEPTGIVMRDAQLLRPPFATRSSLGVSSDGTLDVQRVAFFGTWKGTGAARVLNELNKVPQGGQTALFTSAWGPVTPQLPRSAAAVLLPFPPTTPNTDLGTVVTSTSASPSVAIPPGGAVLVARGGAAARLRAEAPAGAPVTVRLILRPDWTGIVSAIGGGPQIVRDGAPVFRAGEDFTSGQIAPRAARTAVGQLRNGRVIMVTAGGPEPGFSSGLTNFELAQALVRLGAVTAMALDSGGSSTMAFDGTLLNRPSGGSERAISSALMFLYRGVYAAPIAAAASPNGDGVDESPHLSYRLVRPSTVRVVVTAPGGRRTVVEEGAVRAPGTYRVAFPPIPAVTPPSPPPSPEPTPPVVTAPPATEPVVTVPAPPPATEPAVPPPAATTPTTTAPPPTTIAPPATPAPPPASPAPATGAGQARATAGRARVDPGPGPGPISDGRWTLSVQATDDMGRVSSMTRMFTINRTLGFLRTQPRKLFLPPRGRALEVSWRQARPARIVVTVETHAGELVRTLARRISQPGMRSAVWNGLDRRGKAVRGGVYVVRVAARNGLGTIELSRHVGVQRIVGPPQAARASGAAR